GFGGTIERHIGYSKKSFFFTFDYLSRSDGTPRNLSTYDDILYFALGGKQYASYEQPLNGPYAGLSMGLGIPPDYGVFWDFDFLLGYQLIRGKLAIDLNVAIGYGVFNWRQERAGGSIHYWFDGFVLRPGLSFGVSF
ncbi:hypothetical protein KA005_51045, partial [bacterium]|nr:hypothetical protein [bacterium]